MRWLLFIAIIVLAFCSASHISSDAKYPKFSRVKVKKHMKDTFSFAKKWEYTLFRPRGRRCSVVPRFVRDTCTELTAADTNHIYFTADCRTNVQGGYVIKYCYAEKLSDTLKLTLADGWPAYASEFSFYIIGDRFFFKPRTVYPAIKRGQKITYRIQKQKLTLNNNQFMPGDVIMGYIDAEFIEDVAIPGKPVYSKKLYLKGSIRTDVSKFNILE